MIYGIPQGKRKQLYRQMSVSLLSLNFTHGSLMSQTPDTSRFLPVKYYCIVALLWRTEIL